MNRLGLLLVGGILLLVLIGVGIWFFFFRTLQTPEAPILVPPVAEETSDETVSDIGTYHETKGVYPATTPLKASAGVQADQKAVASMKRFIETEIATFKRDSGVDSITPDDIETQMLGGDRKYALEITYKMYESTGTLSYVYFIYANSLGAHPNTYHRTFTFDTKTGTELTLADLFEPGTSYLEIISDLARERLPDMMSGDVDTDYLERGTEPKVESFERFYLDSGSLVIVFSPYEVGPYAIGTQLLPISLSDLPAIKTRYRP